MHSCPLRLPFFRGRAAAAADALAGAAVVAVAVPVPITVRTAYTAVRVPVFAISATLGPIVPRPRLRRVGASTIAIAAFVGVDTSSSLQNHQVFSLVERLLQERVPSIEERPQVVIFAQDLTIRFWTWKTR